MVANFDNIRQGLDYGYATDPLAFVRWHYDKKRNCIYAIDELYEVKCSNRRAAQWIKSNKYHYQDIIAEVEPKSNAEMRNEHDISKIPNIAKEFENIDYQTDRDGNPKPRLEDKDNHTIDATRYAFNDDMRKQPEPVNVKKTIDTFKKLGL